MPERSSQHPELALLITTEADVNAGFALAERIATRNDYSVRITVVAESPAPLLQRVNSRIDSQAEDKGRYAVGTLENQSQLIIEHLNEFKTIRLLLIPGLDQWNDLRKTIFQNVHAVVACFEPHTGLEEAPSRFLLLGSERRGAARWLTQHWVAHATIDQVTLEELRKPSDADEEDANSSRSEVVLLTTSLRELESMRKPIKSAIEAAPGPVILVRSEPSWLQWLTQSSLPAFVRRFIEPMTRETRQRLAEDLTTFSKLDFEFTALICAASFLASFGLVQDSAAVIIGAMLVAPLMTPILAVGLALAQGNRPLLRGSLKTIAIGFAAALLTSTLFGWLLRMLPNSFFETSERGVVLTGEMWARTSPTIIDFLVGFVGGAAAAFARTRNHLSAALAGAAIAAALVPPIATAGLQISLLPLAMAEPDGLQQAHNLIIGPILLFLANALTIMVAASFVLWLCGIRSDHDYSPRDLWATRIQIILMILIVGVAIWIIGHP